MALFWLLYFTCLVCAVQSNYQTYMHLDESDTHMHIDKSDPHNAASEVPDTTASLEITRSQLNESANSEELQVDYPREKYDVKSSDDNHGNFDNPVNLSSLSRIKRWWPIDIWPENGCYFNYRKYPMIGPEFDPNTADVIPFDTKGYWQCKQYLCKDTGWWETGALLPECSSSDMSCWDWNTQQRVPRGRIIYYRCYAYVCSDEDWKLLDVDNADTRCIIDIGSPIGNITGCIFTPTGEKVYFGVRRYYKCEQYECTLEGPLHTFVPTGLYNPGCKSDYVNYSELDEEDIACWDLYENKPVPIGYRFYHNCTEFTCTKKDLIPTGERDPRCSNFTDVPDGSAVSDVVCVDLNTKEIVPQGTTILHKCNEYECTEHDWKPLNNRKRIELRDHSCYDPAGSNDFVVIIIFITILICGAIAYNKYKKKDHENVHIKK